MVGIPDLIVTRHLGAVAWLTTQLPVIGHTVGWEYRDGFLESIPSDDIGRVEQECDDVYVSAHIPVRSEITNPDDVRGKTVVGNLPFHLAAICGSMTVIEFAGAPPRGTEYGAKEMEAAGARLVTYTVRRKE